MATMRCPECGREYALSATRCTVDDTELVETLAGDEALPTPPTVEEIDVEDTEDGEDGEDADLVEEVEGEQVTYELGEWSGSCSSSCWPVPPWPARGRAPT